MMIKKIFYIGLLAVTTVTYAQTNRVGINTKKPQETLDVDGTMKIDDAGEAARDVVPLGWIPVNTDGTGGKLVKKTKDTYTPLAYLTYKINLKSINEDWANGVNLKIDADKYTALIVQAYLVRSLFNFTNPSDFGTYIQVVAKKKDVSEQYPIRSHGGKLYRGNTNNNLVGNVADNGKYFVGAVLPDFSLRIQPSNGKKYYFFYGDYTSVRPLEEYWGPYSWVVSILTIEKPKTATP